MSWCALHALTSPAAANVCNVYDHDLTVEMVQLHYCAGWPRGAQMVQAVDEWGRRVHRRLQQHC